MVGRQHPEYVEMPSVDLDLPAHCPPGLALHPRGLRPPPGAMEPTPYPSAPHEMPSGPNTIETLPRLRSPAHGNPGRGCNSPTDHAPDVLHDGRGDVRGSGSDVIPEPGLCAGCGDRISDRYYLQAVEKPWHARCLRCAQCHLPLDSEQTCYARDGSIFCKEDYYRLFAIKRCAGCHLGISANDLVMKARDLVYHMNCFTCASCHKLLITGEHFGMKENLIYCRLHYEMVLQGEFFPSSGGHVDHFPSLPPGGMPVFNVGGAPKGRPRKRKRQTETELDMCGQPLGLCGNENELLGLGGDMSVQGRQKRMRTSFKHHQLRIMKSYFQLNHNPDAKDLKQLAQKTGLSKRVLQVWFQNARAKHRRNLLKQDPDNKNQLSPGEGNNNNNNNPMSNEDSTEANTLAELSNAPSPAFSDNSTSHSLSEAGSRTGYMEYEQSLSDYHEPPAHPHLHLDHGSNTCSTETSGLTELFRSSFNAMN